MSDTTHRVWMHDLSTRAGACRGAIEALSTPGDRVTLLHATGDFPSDHGPVADEARAVLEPVCALLREEGFDAELLLVSGRPVDALTALSEQSPSPDMVLAGATGVSGLDRVLVGSEAQRLVRKSPIPTLIVGAPFVSVRRVVCPVSPIDPDVAAIREAARICLHHSADLELVAVEPAGSGREDLPSAIAAVRSTLARADDLLAALPGHTVRAVLGETVLHGILIASRGADLIVVGSHGRTGFERWLLGSTAESLVSEGQRNVLVVRHTA